MRAPRQKLLSAFSLLELLVAMGIIALIVALIIPAVKSAKLSARDIQCGQNLRQIHMALALYCNDHDNKYPEPLGFDQQWRQLTYFANTLRTVETFHCPLSQGDTAPGQATWNWWHPPGDETQWTEYKLNDHSALTGKEFGSQHRPQQVVIVIDSLEWEPRHRGKCNLCFFDGHIRLVEKAEYLGPEPGRTSPDVWWKWGLED